MALRQALVHRKIRFDATRNARRHDHRPRPSVELPLCDDLRVKMLDHHRRFLRDDLFISLDKRTQFFLCALLVKLRVILHRLANLVPAVNRRIIL